MTKEKPLRALLDQLNTEYSLSDEFKIKVSDLIARLEETDLPEERLQILALKVRETYQRQALVESYRKESRKSLEKLQSSVTAYLSELDTINQKLNQAEAALEILLNTRPTATVPLEEKKDTLVSKEKAKALAAFANINSKNSRVQ
ncbi:MAG: hypothetical protein DMG05_08950 [Acidobacteria bacterium]|nr:MAG: hypothetical protein DMG05_08950 [Acidobacteriota bacterium]